MALNFLGRDFSDDELEAIGRIMVHGGVWEIWRLPLWVAKLEAMESAHDAYYRDGSYALSGAAWGICRGLMKVGPIGV